MQNKAKPRPQRKKFLVLGLVTLGLLTLFFIYQRTQPTFDYTKNFVQQKECKLNDSSCTVRLPHHQSLTLDVTPRPFHAKQPIVARTKMEGLDPTLVQILILPAKTDNKNSTHILSLQPQDTHQYIVSAKMPDITQHQQEWIMMVFIQTKDSHYAVPFRFNLTR
jgi:hypothetical protein